MTYVYNLVTNIGTKAKYGALYEYGQASNCIWPLMRGYVLKAVNTSKLQNVTYVYNLARNLDTKVKYGAFYKYRQELYPASEERLCTQG